MEINGILVYSLNDNRNRVIYKSGALATEWAAAGCPSWGRKGEQAHTIHCVDKRKVSPSWVEAKTVLFLLQFCLNPYVLPCNFNPSINLSFFVHCILFQSCHLSQICLLPKPAPIFPLQLGDSLMFEHQLLEVAPTLCWCSFVEILWKKLEDLAWSMWGDDVLSLVFGVEDVLVLVDEGYETEGVGLAPTALLQGGRGL